MARLRTKVAYVFEVTQFEVFKHIQWSSELVHSNNNSIKIGFKYENVSSH